MPWIKAKKYKHPPHAKYAGKWDAGKTPQAFLSLLWGYNYGMV